MTDTYSGINLLIVRVPVSDKKGEAKYCPHYYDNRQTNFSSFFQKPNEVIADFERINLEDKELISAWCSLASAKSTISPKEAESDLIAKLERKFNEKNDKQQ